MEITTKEFVSNAAMLLLQELLESQMNMRLSAMQEMAQADPASRSHTGLLGAHMPQKGFYLSKPAQPMTMV